MKEKTLNEVLDGLVEELAAVEHERWAHWQRYLHSKCMRQPDGSLLIPAELASRWQEQMTTDYAELGDEQKQSDRDQVLRYLPLIKARLARLNSS